MQKACLRVAQRSNVVPCMKAARVLPFRAVRALVRGSSAIVGLMLASVGVCAAAVPSLPNVQLPKVVAPTPLSLPKPMLPLPTLPKLPAGGAAGGVGSEQPSGSGSSPGGLAAPSIITGPTVGEAAPPPSSGGSGSAPSSSEPAQPSDAERARQAKRRRQAAASERRFRATVRHLSSCLVAAQPFERRVLVMRVGLQRRRARSLDAVADR